MTPTCKVCLGACQSTQPEVIQVSMYSVGPGALLLPPGWDASPSQGYPTLTTLPVPIYNSG